MNSIGFYSVHSSVLRAVIMAPLAALTTALLVILMQSLIAGQPVETPVAPEYFNPDIVMPPPQLETVREILPPELIEPTVLPPIAPVIEPKWEHEHTQGNTLAVYTPPPIRAVGVANSREPIAKLTVAPEYPYAATRRGIEGYVDVSFDVTRYGTTSNISILASEPERIFDKAAIASIKRWKFTPNIVNGEASDYRGMTRRVRFQLEK